MQAHKYSTSLPRTPLFPHFLFQLVIRISTNRRGPFQTSPLTRFPLLFNQRNACQGCGSMQVNCRIIGHKQTKAMYVLMQNRIWGLGKPAPHKRCLTWRLGIIASDRCIAQRPKKVSFWPSSHHLNSWPVRSLKQPDEAWTIRSPYYINSSRSKCKYILFMHEEEAAKLYFSLLALHCLPGA